VTTTLDTEPCPACRPREGLRDTTMLERVVRRLVDTIVRTQVRLRKVDPTWQRVRDELRGPPAVDIRANIASTIAYINARYGLCSDCQAKLNRAI